MMHNLEEGLISGSIAAVLLTARWTGCAPLSVRKVSEGWQVALSPLLVLCGYFISVVLTVVTAAGVLLDVTVEQKSAVRVSSNTRMLAWLIDVFLSFCVVNTGLFGARSRMNSTIECLNILYKVNNELGLKSFKWHHSKEKCRSVFFFVWSLISIVMVCLDYAGITKIVLFGEQVVASTSGTIALFYIAYHLSSLMHNILQMQFLMMALSITSSYKGVNEHLLLILQDVKASSFLKFNKNLTLAKNADNMVINSLPVPKKRTSSKTTSNDILPPFESIHQLCGTFASLCDVQRRVDTSYGPVLIFLLGFRIVQMIVTPYYLINNIYGSVNPDDAQLFFALQVVWCVIHSINLIILIEPGHYTQTQVAQTKELLSMLMRYTESELDLLSVELEMFYRQLMLNDVVYSPMGVTSLTRAVAAGIFGSTITYLIVLVQMQ